jgi:transposase-like protein
MATVGVNHPLYRSPRHSAPCPHCRVHAGTQTLLTPTVGYFLCEHCGHRWQVAREPQAPHCHDKVDAIKPAVCPSCGSQAVGTLAKAVTAETMWRCQRCGDSWQVQRGNARFGGR